MFGVIATAVSALPVLWMAVLATVQFANLWMDPPYFREFIAIAAFWIGLVAAIAFFRRCVTTGVRSAISPWLIAAILLGIVGGVAEELMLLDNAKTSFAIGFFELAPLSWVAAGIVGAKLISSSKRVPHAA